MSIDYYTHVGPYIFCGADNFEKIVDKEIKTCPNKSCIKHGKYYSDTFCSKCGSIIGITTFKATVKKFNRSDIYNMFNEDEFMIVDNIKAYIGENNLKSTKIYLIPNKNEFYKGTLLEHKNFNPKYTDPFVYNISTKNVADEIEYTINYYEEHINKLKEFFNVVEVYWGIVFLAM